MRVSCSEPQDSLRRWRLVILVVGLSLATMPLWSRAQDAAEPEQATEPVAAPEQPKPAPQPPSKAANPGIPSVWDLAVQGGIFMIPIGLCSVVVVAFSIERFFGLRAKKIVPPQLLVAIQQLNS